MRSTLVGSLILALGVFAVAAPGQAQQLQYAQGDPGLSDAVINQRLRFLEERLDDSKLHGQIWTYSWYAINGGTVVGSAISSAYVGHDARVANIANGTKAAIGLTRMILDPVEAKYGADRIRTMPEGTRAEKLAKLQAAEEQLERNAEREDERYDWRPHLGNAVLNGVAGGVVAGLTDASNGLQVGLGGFIGGLAFLFTQPWGPSSDWEEYQALKNQSSEVDMDVYVSMLPGGAKLNFSVKW